MLTKEYDFYLQNQADYLSRYHGKFLVFHYEQLIEVYDNRKDAYHHSEKRFPLGTFLIQECLREDERQPRVFHSRVVVT